LSNVSFVLSETISLSVFETVSCTINIWHIVNDDSSIISKWSSKLIDDAGVIIYAHNMFIIQATVTDFTTLFWLHLW
jgi:hypothetical protein